MVNRLNAELSKITANAQWTPRAGLQVVELGGRFFLMGGRTPINPAISPVPGASFTSTFGPSTFIVFGIVFLMLFVNRPAEWYFLVPGLLLLLVGALLIAR